ncbi:MAG: acetyl-CoA hydrolase [Gammaproteobacteria bacterium]|nr:acetyl-CoA hydrolase [Gammaproteobacteria bacterium]
MTSFTSIADTVDKIVERLDGNIVMGCPLGLGKPNQLIDALYERAKTNSDLKLTILTALTLERPAPKSGLEGRLANPIIERIYGDYQDLNYAVDRRRQNVPDNIEVIEFFLTPGKHLNNAYAQQHFLASNYTHVARDSLARGMNLIVQLIATREHHGQQQFSLASNPDLTLDVAPMMRQRKQPCLVVGQVHDQLPFMAGDAIVAEDYFDVLIADSSLNTTLFSIPKSPVSNADYLVGLHASSLIKDGGTLQIGIGSLGDALAYALCLRQTQNKLYQALFEHLPGNQDTKNFATSTGGTDCFDEGLYGATEMLVDGFLPLIEHGVIKRRVFDDETIQQAVNNGNISADELRGYQSYIIHAGFYLGCRDFYHALCNLDDQTRASINMTRVSRINQLYGTERLDRLQRQHARFANSCLKVTATGAVISDGLSDNQVLSGVGGQYNFVAMAHELENARSLMQLRSTRRNRQGELESNIVWTYDHTTVPRHLRDIVITEYGIADLRGKTDAEVIKAMLTIADSRFQDELLKKAKRAKKIDQSYQVPDDFRKNTPDCIRKLLQPYRDDGWFADYPLGSDLTAQEQLLAKRLRQLQKRARTTSGKLSLASKLLSPLKKKQQSDLVRLGLDQPQGIKERAYARLLSS